MSLACAPALAVEPILAADTHVNAALPSVNSGTLSNIAVGSGYTGLLQFDLSTLPTGTTAAQISKATLRLYVNRVDTAGTISVLPLTGSWSEYGVTYATLPATGTAFGSIAVSQTGSFVTLDVTAQVQSWLTSPAANNGLALTSGTAAVQFDSKENDLTAHPAALDVTLVSGGATGATGPQGIPGIAGAVGATGAVGPAGAKGATGANGAPGSAGATGVAGAVGPAGLTGPSGPAGPTGAAGPQGIHGLPGVGIEGPYASATNYGLNDVVTWQGSSWYSLQTSNHGNTPDQSPQYWAVLAAAGIGTTGATGAAGPLGPPGLTGPQGSVGITGVQGPTGIQGPRGFPGLVYQGVYASAINYALGDVVLWQGASWASLVDANHGNTPSDSPAYWGVLTQQGPIGLTGGTGVAGPTGATGALGPVGPPGERGDQGLQGIPGQAGAQGIPGVTGAQGLSGPAGPQGVPGPVGVAFQGTYSSTANYALADGVIYNGGGYVSLISGNHGNTPDQSPAAWSLFATGTPGGPGPAGIPGAAGATGPQGQQGFTGATGPQGPIGPQGPPTVTYTGNYSSATSYNVNDAAAYHGSTYVSMTADNHGNTPDQSPASWTVLVAQGAVGAPGTAGPAGAAGATGTAGPAGATGPQGPSVSFSGAWSASHAYSLGDAVSYSGSSYIALTANTGREPDQSPQYWAVLAAAGSAGPAGATGPQGLEGPTGYAGPQGPAGPAGSIGPQGPAGAVGATGPGGPAGAAGPQGANGIPGLAYRGAYNSATNYGLNDGVVYAGSTYISLAAGNTGNTGNTPDSSSSFWGLLAAQGAAGAVGAAGTNGINGAAGATGATGPQGSQGPAGAAGANGAAGLIYQGTWSSVANYALNDAVTYQGSSYLSLASGNHGNAPAASSSSWAVLAQMGSPGATGSTGATGSSGPGGAQGPSGPQGAQGANGAAGINFRGAWVAGSGYAVNDAVTYQGATYLAQTANSSVMPGSDSSTWAVLAAAGSTGATGAAGSAASVSIGTVTTGAAGSAASVSNSGSAAAAVLNFTIPQGVAGASGTGSGGGGGAGTSGVPYAAMYHAVSYAATYYSVNNTNQSASETPSVLTWVPQGCSATRLDVFSQQGATITVTLRTGAPGAMADSVLSCQVATGKSCSVTGSVAVAAGQFVDIGITRSDSNAVGVWTAVSCN